ncbi:MAG: glycosyltransferase family 9 protein [Bacteroidales bacterium]
MKDKNYKSFLVIQTASIGDVILATPVLEALNSRFPGSIIDILVKKGNESLFTGHPFLHQVLIWDKSTQKYRNLRNLMAEVHQRKYDVVINIQRFAGSGLLTWWSNAKVTVGFGKNPLSLLFTHRVPHLIGKGGIHETERNLSLLKPLCGEVKAPVKLYPRPEDDAKMSQFKTRQYVTISPASLWFTKQLPAEQWIDLINKIPEPIHVYLLGSRNDQILCDKIMSSAKRENILNLAGKTSFLETASLMRQATMNWVNDSAPMHLASAVDAPVTAVFCSTVPDFGFGPLSTRSKIVQTHEKLSCRPCGIHGRKKCPEGHFKCATTIATEDLFLERENHE